MLLLEEKADRSVGERRPRTERAAGTELSRNGAEQDSRVVSGMAAVSVRNNGPQSGHHHGGEAESDGEESLH